MTHVVAGLGLAVLLASAAPAAAQPAPTKCSPSLATALVDLRDHQKEVMVTARRNADGVVIVDTANPDGTSWSMLAIEPGGKACMVSWGNHWASIKAGEPLPSVPAQP